MVRTESVVRGDGSDPGGVHRGYRTLLDAVERHDAPVSLRSRIISRAERAFVRPYLDRIDFSEPRDRAKLARLDRIASRLRPPHRAAVEPVSLGRFRRRMDSPARCPPAPR